MAPSKSNIGRRSRSAINSRNSRLRQTTSEEILRKRKKKREAEAEAREGTTSFWSQDGSTASSSCVQDSECDYSTSGRGFVATAIKQEGVKEELMLEDYAGPDDPMEYQSPKETEGINVTKEAEGVEQPLPADGGPFETVICGTGDVKIKQEIFEDESDAFSSSHEVVTVPSWSVPTVKESSSHPVSNEPQSALKHITDPPNFSSMTTIKVPPLQPIKSPLDKSLTQVSKTKMKTSGKKQKAAPALRLENCKICVNEIFCSPSDLMEHYILKHSDVSSRFFPSVEPPPLRPFSAAVIPGFSGSAAHGSSDANATAASSPGPSETPSLSVANMQGQPPHNVIPPYISSCDVFDGVFISLRNIPAEHKKITKEKLAELVQFISSGNDPALISFSRMDK